MKLVAIGLKYVCKRRRRKCYYEVERHTHIRRPLTGRQVNIIPSASAALMLQRAPSVVVKPHKSAATFSCFTVAAIVNYWYKMNINRIMAERVVCLLLMRVSFATQELKGKFYKGNFRTRSLPNSGRIFSLSAALYVTLHLGWLANRKIP